MSTGSHVLTAISARARRALAQGRAWRASREPSRFGWRGLASLGFLVAFVASFALAGFSYMFCLSIGHVQTVCCCHPASASADAALSKEEPGPALDRAPCCETRHFEAAQASSSVLRDPAPTVAPPAVILVADILPSVPMFAPRAIPVVSQERPVPLGRAPPPTAVHLQTVRLLC